MPIHACLDDSGSSAARVSQSGWAPLTKIEAPCSLAEVLQAAPDTAGKLLFQPPARSEAEMDLPDTLDPARQIWLLLGPEEGFSAPELDLIAGASFRRCTLGATVLRAETAMVAAIMAVRLLWYRAAPRPEA